MPRSARASVGGLCYYVLNRGNRRETVLHKPEDYDAFVKAMADAYVRLPMDLIGYCLMPNHFHLVIRPWREGDLGHWMQWLLTAHAPRYHRHYGATGHVWQGRFKAFPIDDEDHFRTVLRYVERNPLRAELVERGRPGRNASDRIQHLGPGRRAQRGSRQHGLFFGFFRSFLSTARRRTQDAIHPYRE